MIYDKKATVREPVVIEGIDPFRRNKNVRAEIRPGNEGMYFTINSDRARIPYDIHHLYAQKNIVGARYNVVSSERDDDLTGTLKKGREVRAIEHLVSGMCAAGITDAEINIQSGDSSTVVSAPSNGPGIKHYFELMKKYREELDRPIDIVRFAKPDGYKSNDKKTGGN